MNAQEQKIEQLEVELSGCKGLLGEIVSIANLFLPILERLPETDKRMVGELRKRLQITNMMLSMEKQNPPTIVSSMGF